MLNNLPDSIARSLDDYRTSGENHRTSSKAGVFRYEREDGAGLFLKINADPCYIGLEAEKERMQWIGDRLPVPQVVDYCREGAEEYLLTTALPGSASHRRENHGDKVGLVDLLAQGLRQIHALPIAGCAFDRSYDALAERAIGLVESGLRSEADLVEDGWRGGAAEVVEWFAGHRPESEDLVFTHGDYCLPNILLEDGALTGFVDLGYAGVADRYLDLAACAQSIARNVGAQWVVPFFSAYGIDDVDDGKLAFYKRVIVS